MHWGAEYEESANERQKDLAGMLSENGADVIVGSHPHVVQQTEIIPKEESGHETTVYYSLGNFLSAQERKECRQRAFAEFMICKGTDGKISIIKLDDMQ